MIIFRRLCILMAIVLASKAGAVDIPADPPSQWKIKVVFYSTELHPAFEYSAEIDVSPGDHFDITLKRRPSGTGPKEFKVVQTRQPSSKEAVKAYSYTAAAFKEFDFSKDRRGMMDGGLWSLTVIIGSNSLSLSHDSVGDLKQVSPNFAKLLDWLWEHLDERSVLTNESKTSLSTP